MQGLQPHVAQSQHGVGVVLCGRLLQDSLKLLLTRSPLLLGQVKVPYEGPGVGVVLGSTTQARSRTVRWRPEKQRCGVMHSVKHIFSVICFMAIAHCTFPPPHIFSCSNATAYLLTA